MTRWLFLTIVILLLISCKKEDTTYSGNIIYASIGTNETLNINLGGFGDEEGVSINKQAMHFQVSKIDLNLNNYTVIYTYSPIQNYIGTDEVELMFSRGSDGASPSNNITYSKIKITIIP